MNATKSSQMGTSNDEMEVYKTVAAFLTSEHEIFWTRNNLLIVIQAALFAAAVSFTSDIDKILADPNSEKTSSLYVLQIALLILFLVGLISAAGWLFMVERSRVIVSSLLDQLKNMESQFANRQTNALNPAFLAFTNFDREVNSSTHTFLRRYPLWVVWKRIVEAFFLLWSLLVVMLVFTWFSQT